MEENGWLASYWGESESNRRAKFYRLTKAGEQQLGEETEQWQKIALAMTRRVEEHVGGSRRWSFGRDSQACFGISSIVVRWKRTLMKKVRTYVEMLTEEHKAAGMEPQQARRRAALAGEFGGA